jgi:aspartate oxidase
VDTLKGGHMQNDHQLLKVMVEEGPSIAKWLLSLGVLFDRDADGNLHVKKGGGSSKPRLLTCSDYTGLEIMRVLKDEVLNQNIQLLEFCAAVESSWQPSPSFWRPAGLAGSTFKDSRPAITTVRPATGCAWPIEWARSLCISIRSSITPPVQSIPNSSSGRW